jgi:hypothetical protein
MKELKELISKKVEACLATGIIEKTIEKNIEQAIEKNIEQAVEKAIASQFDEYEGGIRKQLNELFAEKLRIDIDEIPIRIYNEQMLVAVKRHLSNMFEDRAAARFNEEIEKFLAPAPEDIDIHDFINEVVEKFREYRQADDAEEVTIKLGPAGVVDGYRLELVRGRDQHVYKGELSLYITLDGHIRISHRHNYSPYTFCPAEAYVFKLYAAGSRITGIDSFDASNCDLSL